jgi:hypothetical protein
MAKMHFDKWKAQVLPPQALIIWKSWRETDSGRIKVRQEFSKASMDLLDFRFEHLFDTLHAIDKIFSGNFSLEV